jgi:hypothetical protein
VLPSRAQTPQAGKARSNRHALCVTLHALAHEFEDLQATPQAIIQALLARCGLPMPEPDQLARVLAEDSQAGAVGAQDMGEPVRRLTDAELA